MTIHERSAEQLLLDAKVRDACFDAEQKINEWETHIEQLAQAGMLEASVIALLRQQAREAREAVRASLLEYEEVPHASLLGPQDDE